MARAKLKRYDIYFTSIEPNSLGDEDIKTQRANTREKSDIVTVIESFINAMPKDSYIISISVIEHPQWAEITPGT